MKSKITRRVPGILTAFHLKRKFVSSASLGTLVLLSLLYFHHWNTSNDGPPFPTTELAEPLVYDCCIPSNKSIRTNIYFIKIHKTGSATTQNTILRFAIAHSLDVMNIIYPKSFHWPISDSSIYENTSTANGKYHVLAHHIRYDPGFKSYQYPDTSMITLLRHPAAQFQSSYHFFRWDKVTGKTFEQFLKAPSKPDLILPNERPYRGYNQQSFALGFDLSQVENKRAIDEFIGKIDQDFDFVMITEHMDASLILMANLMGWPLENIAHVDLNVRPVEPNSYTLTEEDKITLMKYNEVDTLLYYHFLEKFRKCVRQYGEEKLNQQIERLKMLNEQLKERCVGSQVVGGYGHRFYQDTFRVMEYVLKNQSDLECVYATQISPPLANTVRDLQAERFQQLNTQKIGYK